MSTAVPLGAQRQKRDINWLEKIQRLISGKVCDEPWVINGPSSIPKQYTLELVVVGDLGRGRKRILVSFYKVVNGSFMVLETTIQNETTIMQVWPNMHTQDSLLFSAWCASSLSFHFFFFHSKGHFILEQVSTDCDYYFLCWCFFGRR